ncbi:hypothetical protein ACN42_g10383, partial [Penicillium freii]
ALK